MTEQLWKIEWKNSLGETKVLSHLTEKEAHKFEQGFKSEGKEISVCQM